MARLNLQERRDIIDQILLDTGAEKRLAELRAKLELEFKNAYWASLPKEVQVLRGKSSETYLQQNNIEISRSCNCLRVKVPYSYSSGSDAVASKARANSGVVELHKIYEAAVKEFEELRSLTKANVHSCSTDVQFKARFPDLVKYLPPVIAPVANLPATTEFTDRLKAAGLKLGE
jgi:hypothetical protein